ncbi:MAG: CHAT domain-containing protein [Haliscomenobacter sp.]|uniref:CHAT domain-containing protein n=1 Tax=Haliscomenobacter sp. TaxID=2717303 RepID=UPI0029A41978|nr:CHAT domain-containing protein [Haliscomenobacter sp.]MDX2067049.1 CHAT domain-containing protein [Haliscomenobacter sp.]
MKQPVIFLAFANDKDDHLPLLDEERKVINGHLLPLANQQYLQLVIEPSATTADISRFVTDLKDRINIFHYGGHAGSKEILLQDQTANSDGIAQLLALQKELKVVFLNGCSTRAQVGLLQELGIPAIIATSIPIADQAARTFSDVFYRALAEDHTLEEAYKLAAANHLMTTGQAAGINRGLRVRKEETDPLPWGLYITEGREAVLNWKIPRQSAGSFIVRGAGLKYQSGVVINQKLVMAIANAIAPHSRSIQLILDEAKSKNREPKMRDLRVAVIDSFPTPIGMHLRKLLIVEEIGTDRLQKIVNLYQVSAQFLAYVLLAQVWDEKFNNPDYPILPITQSTLKTFLSLPAADSPAYNFVNLIEALGDTLAESKTPLFVEEFNTLRKQYQEEPELKTAVLFLEEMKRELMGAVAADEIESFCVQGEDKLCEIFKHIGFAAKYTLATIKTIELIKPRHETPRFRHNLVVLNQLTAAIGVLDDVLETAEYTDNNSVILMRDEETVSPSLNLSPFILDENALSGQQNSKLFFFTSYENKQINFTLIDNLKDSLNITRDNYPLVSELFDGFINKFKV